MSEQDTRPLVPLTPTERRIAEMAYAREGVWLAVQKVHHLRGERGPTATDPGAVASCDAMLAELRRSPEHPCDEHDRRILRLVDANKHMRALLEALVACDNVSASVSAIQAVIASARKELGR